MSQKDIENAFKLLEEYVKNKKPSKKGHIIFMRNIPFVVSEDAYAKYVQVEVFWLNPKLAEDAIKALNLNNYEKRRPKMYA